MHIDTDSPIAVEGLAALLRSLVRSAPERMSLGEVVMALEDRGFGVIVFCLALPNALPGPFIPGFSTVLALPIAWLGLQLLLGWEYARLPGFLRRRSIDRGRLARFVDRAVPLIGRFEGWLEPRPGWLTRGQGRCLLGGALILFGFFLALPIPLGNVPVAIGITVLSLGLIEQDSRALALGLVSGLIGCLWDAGLIALGIAAAQRLSSYPWLG